jgi:acyl-CoA thioesterase I
MAASSIAAGKKLLRFAFAFTFLGGSVLALLFTGCSRQGGAEGMADKPMIAAGPIVYVALGDSTGYGVGAREGGYVKRLFTRINERRPGSTLQNLCVSGATTADLIRGQLERAVALNPDLVTVGIGVNDIGHGLSLEQFSKNYDQILSTLKEKTHAQIVVTNIPDVSSAPRIPNVMRSEYQRQIDQFCRRLEEIANRHGVTVFDVYTITKDELPSHPEYFSGDGFHPSDEGYELWATQMWPTIAKVLGEPE